MLPARATKILKVLIGTLGVLFVLVAGSGLYLYRLSATLPDLAVDPDSLKTERTSVVYAADGSVIAEWHAEQDRRLVTFADIPEDVRDAVVAIEDERFYEHNGVDGRAVARALAINGRSRSYEQGGSTITQQVVKLLFTDGKRTITRKAREALMAYQLETKADKDKVLETYLNLVYFGHGSYGVESAAKRYFGKRASELDLAQSALLAGVIQSPGRYSPVSDPGAAKERRALVLRKMREQGSITAEEEAAASARPITVVASDDAPKLAPHFSEYVKQELIRRLGADKVFRGGLRVYTTLDPALQRAAERSVKRHLNDPRDPVTAIASIDHKTGAVVAMIGGRDFRADQFNLAVQGKRQPGSAFKPFVLVTALQQGISPERVFAATPYEVQVKDGIWRVDNYENDKTSPKVTLRTATAWSVNAVYARLIMIVGPEKVVENARAMGVSTPLDPNPAIALGGLKHGVSPLEMAQAYGTIANGGVRVEPRSIVKVTDDRGRIVWEPKDVRKRVLAEPVAERTAELLHGVVQNGTGVEARHGRWAAGKTGTTQSYRDAWFVGWSSGLSTAVWVGYPQGQVAMEHVHGIKVTGGSFPARIWRDYMADADTASGGGAAKVGAPKTTTTRQRVLVKVCQQTFLQAKRTCPDVQEVYLEPGLVPHETCNAH